jgi:hypothetical protein
LGIDNKIISLDELKVFYKTPQLLEKEKNIYKKASLDIKR